MLSVKKLLTKILTKTSGSYTYNTNNGTLVFAWRRCLWIIFATATVKNTSTWSTGSGNRITCTVDSHIPLPSNVVVGVELNGIFAHINGTTFRAQNNTGGTMPANSSYDISMTYIA